MHSQDYALLLAFFALVLLPAPWALACLLGVPNMLSISLRLMPGTISLRTMAVRRSRSESPVEQPGRSSEPPTTVTRVPPAGAGAGAGAGAAGCCAG